VVLEGFASGTGRLSSVLGMIKQMVVVVGGLRALGGADHETVLQVLRDQTKAQRTEHQSPYAAL
jgi:hypothetical protein